MEFLANGTIFNLMIINYEFKIINAYNPSSGIELLANHPQGRFEEEWNCSI
jgi:hypothetical protein